MTKRGDKLPFKVLLAYYGTVLAFFAASFFPECRVWGIDWWAYFPLWIKLGLLAIGLIAPFVIDLIVVRKLAGREDISAETYRWLMGGFAALIAALFYLLRARTYFLGDGYTLLSLLSSENHLIKPHEYGGTIVQYAIYVLLGSNGSPGALIAYQIVSIVSGVLFLTISVWATTRLVPNLLHRLLLILILSTAGYTLLFFGYVENYSLFVVSVALYGLVGLLIIDHHLSRWWIIPAVLFSATQHIFGVVLIPPAIGLLLWGTRIGRRLADRSTSLKIVLGGALAGGATAVFMYSYSTNLFFRLALLSFQVDKFTAGGYTLFSIDHLVDFANLIILLFPGIAVAALVAFQFRHPRFSAEFVLLAGVTACCLGAAFIFDPKLGMPRDWDLFAFAGVPLTLSFVYGLVRIMSSRMLVTALLLIAMLNLLTLIPRAVAVTNPEIAIAHTRAYANLDVVRSGPARYLVSKYLYEHGDTARALQEGAAFRQLEPDLYLIGDFQTGRSAMDSSVYAVVLERAIVRNPTAWGPWANLGVILLGKGLYDSALHVLTIADALNPYNAKTYSNLANAYFYLKDFSRAESHWMQSLKYEPSKTTTLVGLARLYQATGDQTRYSEYFAKVVARSDAPPEYLRKLGDYFVQQSRFQEASVAYGRAVQNGLDSLVVDTIRAERPELNRYFRK